MERFRDKVVWITGASSGIGREIAIQLHQLGCKLVLSARSKQALTDLKSQLSESNDIMVLPIDLSKQETFKPIVAEVYSHFGRCDILFNNAGVSQRSTVVQTSLKVDRRIMEINYFGTIALTKALLPNMLAHGGGRFVIVSSVVGKFGYGVRSAYSASKHALHGFFESLHIELAKDGIDVTIVCPGPVQTEISKHALNGSGQPSGKMDEMQQNGMPVEKCVRYILKGIAQGKHEIIVGDFKTKLGVVLKAIAPRLFFKLALKQDPQGELII